MLCCVDLIVLAEEGLYTVLCFTELNPDGDQAFALCPAVHYRPSLALFLTLKWLGILALCFSNAGP